jgi:hypothetical protein
LAFRKPDLQIKFIIILPSSLLRTDNSLTGGQQVSGLLFLFPWYKQVNHQAKTDMHLLLNIFYKRGIVLGTIILP